MQTSLASLHNEENTDICEAAAWAPGGHKEHREVMGCPPHPMSCDGNPPTPVPGTALCHQHHTGKELQTSSQVVLGVS